MAPFLTHTGDLVDGERLQAALSQVASDWRDLARAIRHEDAYASHVTEDCKEANLQSMLLEADAIEAGSVQSFTIWQRVNAALTGEYVPFLAGAGQ